MNLIKNNPYRTVGLLVGATAKEQTKQISKLKKYIEAEQDPQDDFSFPALGDFHRTIDSVEEAASKLNLDNDKINAALFWFWNGNPITDEAAFDALKDGNTDDAIEIWRKLIYNSEEEMNEVTKRNASAFFNLSTLYLIEYGIDEETLQLKLHFLGSDFVKEFKSAVTDETYKIEKGELQLNFLNNLINHNDIDHSELMEAISDIDFEGKQEFLKSFIQKPIEKIEHQIETAKNKRKASKANAAKAGKELIEKTVNDLSQLKSFVGSKDLKYTSVADKVANEILQCSIDYFNDCQEKESNSDYTEIAMKLAKQADKLAAGKLTKDRIKDSIETLEEMKDKELSQAIQLLQSVKDAYENSYNEIVKMAKKQLGIYDEDEFLEIGGHRVKMPRLQSYNLFETRTINYDAVENAAKQSIKWENVNEMLSDLLSDKNLKKIKYCEKIEEKKELWELLNWTKDNSLKSSSISNIIEKYKNIPPNLYFEVLSAEVTNTNNKPFYVEDIRYIGLKLKIKSTGTQKVAIYKKYINPEGKYDHSSKSSPEGYTTSTDITIKPETKEIDLGGWGNEKECTYIVGEHKIEVYVEHYKVYTKTFRVDWSPNKKAELKRNLESLQAELSEVEKFQWFRSSETKQKEVKEVQDKIKKAKQILMNK